MDLAVHGSSLGSRMRPSIARIAHDGLSDGGMGRGLSPKTTLFFAK